MAKNPSSPTELYNLSNKSPEPGGLQLMGVAAGLLMLFTVMVVTTQYIASGLPHSVLNTTGLSVLLELLS